MSANSVFQLVDERGWRRGLTHLVQGELFNWFKSRRWWIHTLIWILCINLILFFTMIGTEDALEAGEDVPVGVGGIPQVLELYGIFGGLAVMFGVMIILQGAIVGEKKSGTAAWVLSKPISRTAFVTSKVIGNTVGILVTAVLIPGIVAYIEIGLFARGIDGSSLGWLPPLDFLAAMLLLTIHMLFWLTLAVMLGTFFDSMAGVIAIPIAFAFGQQLIVGIFPFLLYVFPWVLSAPAGDEYPAVAASLAYGKTPFSWMPVISVLILSAVFIVVAIRRFDRQEF